MNNWYRPLVVSGAAAAMLGAGWDYTYHCAPQWCGSDAPELAIPTVTSTVSFFSIANLAQSYVDALEPTAIKAERPGQDLQERTGEMISSLRKFRGSD